MEQALHECIHNSLNNYLFDNAEFYCDRLVAQCPGEESTYLQATCYYRSRQSNRAYHVLKRTTSARCRYLFALCCYELDKLYEAEMALTNGALWKEATNIPMGAAGLHLLGKVCRRVDRRMQAVYFFKESLRLDPMLWASFEALCELGEHVDVENVFGSSSVALPAPASARRPLQGIQVRAPPSAFKIPDSLSSFTPYTPAHKTVSHMEGSPNASPIGLSLPTVFMDTPPALAVTPSPYQSKFEGKLGADTHTPIGNPSLPPSAFVTPDGPTGYSPEVPQLQRKGSRIDDMRTPESDGAPGSHPPGAPPKRRSARLAKAEGRDADPDDPPPSTRKKSKSRTRDSKSAKKKKSKSKDKKERVTEEAPAVLPPPVATISKATALAPDSARKDAAPARKVTIAPPAKDTTPLLNTTAPAEDAEDDKVDGRLAVLSLLKILGEGWRCVSSFRCKEGVEVLAQLPDNHYNTGWVLTAVGRAHYEMVEYTKAHKVFSLAHKLEPHRLAGMEIYSTVLWHLSKEVELSYLAHELVAFDRLAPETWCAVGNCFALQREHEAALKYFRRAVQLSPHFTYAYTLSGHEYVANEDFEKALSFYRNAIRTDERHYNAWYGLGTIYLRQEKYELAEYHFRKALSINPQHSVLCCYLGMVLHASFKHEEALFMLSEAVRIDPHNPLAKFRRASVLMTLQQYEEALSELQLLKEYAPKEAAIYFQIGKVYKKLGKLDKARHYFTFAQDLDSKGSASIKQAVDNLSQADEDDDDLNIINV